MNPSTESFTASGNWRELTEKDQGRFKWRGLFFRKQTPGHFMLRLRLTGGASNTQQFRVVADLCDEYGKGFCDLTTRQQIQLRWFGIGDVPEIECILIEDREPAGPYGAKGIGEPALVPTAPAILGAIYHATGARMTRVPATPDRVLAALKAR
jgi:NAD(P)H-nitrite reductase large subunit